MKTTLLVPSMLLALVVLTGSSACTDGNEPTAPTAPSQPSGPAQPPNGLAIVLMAISTQTVDQPATFVVSASSSVDARLDFGDGDQEAFDLEASVNRTVKHTYRGAGTFVATFTARNAAGESASIVTTLIVR